MADNKHQGFLESIEGMSERLDEIDRLLATPEVAQNSLRLQPLMRERGRGILIMREFTDSLIFGRHADGRFLVRLTKNLIPSVDDD